MLETVTCSTSLVWNPFSRLRLISTPDYTLLQLCKLYTVHFQIENTIKFTITILTNEVTSVVVLWQPRVFHSGAYWTMTAFPYHSMLLFHAGIFHPSISTQISICNQCTSSTSIIASHYLLLFLLLFFWLYNPGWVLVCSTILFHSCLSSTFILQPIIFILFRSSSNWSIHLSLGLPAGLVLYGVHSVIFLVVPACIADSKKKKFK